MNASRTTFRTESMKLRVTSADVRNNALKGRKQVHVFPATIDPDLTYMKLIITVIKYNSYKNCISSSYV